MFKSSNFDRVRQMFADQFSDDQAGLVYRKSQKGPAIRVSAIERDEFIAAFGRRIQYAAWAIFPATAALILLLVWLAPDADSDKSDAMIWIGIGAILVPFLAFFYWAWNAPSRALQCRTPQGAALTKDEARTLALSKISYGQLVLTAVMGAGLTWQMSVKADIFHGTGLIWLILGVGLVVLAVIQAIRKFWFSRSATDGHR